MKEFFSSVKFKILVCVCALLAGFMIYALTDNHSNFIEQGLDFIVTPIKSLSSAISNAVGSFFERHTNVDALYEENERLKDEIASLKEQLIALDEYRLENQQLKEFLEIKELNPSLELETASVIGSDPLDSFGAFTIDKGSLHGVKKNDVVICREGLVGIVSQVNSISSRVTTILDPTVHIGAFISSTQDDGLIKNTAALALENMTQMTMISRETQAAVGDFIITSGTGGVFPKGLLIGSVAEISADANGLSKNAAVRPAADILNVRNVAVIKSFTGQGAEALPSGSSDGGDSHQP